MDQIFNFSETIGSSDSCLEFLFRRFKFFRLRAILIDGAGAARAHSGRRSAYWYMIRWWPNSCLLDHATGLLFRFYVKLSKELVLFSTELVVFNSSKVQGYLFRPPKNYKPREQAASLLVCKEIARNWVKQWAFGLQWASQHSSQRCKEWILCKKNKICIVLATLMDKELENLEHHGCLKNQDVVDEKMWIGSNCSFTHNTTLHCAKLKAKLFGNWIMQHLKL